MGARVVGVAAAARFRWVLSRFGSGTPKAGGPSRKRPNTSSPFPTPPPQKKPKKRRPGRACWVSKQFASCTPKQRRSRPAQLRQEWATLRGGPGEASAAAAAATAGRAASWSMVSIM